MTIYKWVILALWLGLFLYWIVSAINAKRTVGGRNWLRGSGLRLSLIVLILVALRIPGLRHALRVAQAYEARSVLLGLIGVVLCALGIGLAILARVYLGRNWGMPMTRKDNPELIITGPYAYVRHPIYSGMLLATLGSTLGESVVWGLALILFGVYFIYSARQEERIMLERFPEQYRAYMQKTKMLLPFVL